MRVIVIGAGIGGITAALALRQRGIEVEIFERARELTEVGAGISLWANALKALYRLGLEEALAANSFVSEDGALRTADGTILLRTSSRRMAERIGLPVMVFHRADLLDALRRAAEGIPVHLDRECRELQQDADGVTVRFANGSDTRGDAVVGADGLRSVVRECLGIPGPIRYSGYTAWRGIAPFPTAGLVAGETIGCGQRFGLVPISRDRVYWYATDNTAEGQRDEPAQEKARLTRTFAAWHAPIPALIAATDAPAILRNDIVDRDPVDRWGTGRVTLLGDAAHPMTPNLGQGACQAIEDAMVLARCLAESPSDIAVALRRYESERIPRTGSIVKASRRVGQMFQIESRLLCAVRNTALRLTPASAQYRNLVSVAGYEGHLSPGV
jgi:2-polyprenyl-6-methoxyphenol hydroxylase-like FAD-dependent oxidoreductase